MSKSYAQMADEILEGALTDTNKNPYDSATGHQADMPAMDPTDTLIEMTDAQRAVLMGHAGLPVSEEIIEEATAVEEPKRTTMELTPQDLETLSEAKRIIEKIQEMTSVGNIGVSFVGGKGDAKSVKIPGDTNVKPKKRTKKKVKTNVIAQDFLNYIKA